MAFNAGFGVAVQAWENGDSIVILALDDRQERGNVIRMTAHHLIQMRSRLKGLSRQRSGPTIAVYCLLLYCMFIDCRQVLLQRHDQYNYFM